MLVYHISNMEDGALAKEMMEEQVTNKWPGLVEEVNEMCQSMRIEEPNSTEVGKRAYSKIVKEACRWKDEATMKKDMERMKESSIIVLTERRRKKHSYSLLDLGDTFMSQVWTPE